MSAALSAGLEALRARQLALLLAGDRNQALREATEAIEGGIALADLVLEVMAPVQAAIGAAWQQGAITPAQERIATDVADILLTVGAGRCAPEPSGIRLAMCVADHEHHNLPARMVAELLRAEGHQVSFLGYPRPGPTLAKLLRDLRPDAVLLSCSLTMNLPGVVALAALVHESGLPLIAGGAAFANSADRALKAGADAHARRVADVRELMTATTLGGPAVGPVAERMYQWSELTRERRTVATETAERLLWYHLPVIPRSLRDPGTLAAKVVDVLRFVEAAVLVEEQLLIDYALWHDNHHRRVLQAEPGFSRTLVATLREQVFPHHPLAAAAADLAVCALDLPRQ